MTLSDSRATPAPTGPAAKPAGGSGRTDGNGHGAKGPNHPVSSWGQPWCRQNRHLPTAEQHRTLFHHSRLAEHVNPLNPAVVRWTDYHAQTRMFRGGVTRAVADDQAMGLLSQMVGEQARVMAYLDAFWMFAIMAIAALPLILLMKKSVAKGGLAVH